MRKILKAVAVIMFAICMSTFAAAADNINVIINGTPMQADVPAQIIGGRTMVPMRAIFESLNAEISWDDISKTVTANKNGNIIKMTIGAAAFYKNGAAVSLDVPAQIVEGRTFVPIRAVSECLGCDVEWNGGNKTVVITDGEQSNGSYHFRNEKLLNEHFEKHGAEFGFLSAAEYETAASKVINDSRALHKREKEDGDFVYYIKETNEFVILSVDGYIRTYFKPDSGIKYYEKQ